MNKRSTTTVNEVAESDTPPAEMAAERAPAPQPPSYGKVENLLERGGLPLLLLALIVWFAVDPTSGPSFTSSANIQQLLSNQAVTGIIAIAMVVPLVSGYFDLSVSAVAALSNVTAAALMSHGNSVWVAILGALVIALIAGALNGLLIAYLKLDGLITTLGSYILIGGLLQLYTKGETISNGIPTSFTNWAQKNFLGIPWPFWLLIVVSLIVWYVLTQVPFGRKLEAIGSNERAAQLVGIRVERTVFVAFLGSALLGAIAGVLLTSSSASADPTAGPAYLFPALTAVFLGATCITPGRYNVWGTVIGVLLVAVAVNGFTLLGADTWVTPVFNGGALIGAVAASTLIGRRRQSRARGSNPTPVTTVTDNSRGDTV
jgi:ribose transport system permease protein